MYLTLLIYILLIYLSGYQPKVIPRGIYGLIDLLNEIRLRFNLHLQQDIHYWVSLMSQKTLNTLQILVKTLIAASFTFLGYLRRVEIICQTDLLHLIFIHGFRIGIVITYLLIIYTYSPQSTP